MHLLTIAHMSNYVSVMPLLRNRNTQQTWYALSHFAGHLTLKRPVRNYLHLMHLAISYQLNQMHSPLPKEAYFNILKHDDSIKYPVQQAGDQTVFI